MQNNAILTKYLESKESKFKPYFIRKQGKTQSQYYIKYLDKPNPNANERYILVGVHKTFARISKVTGNSQRDFLIKLSYDYLSSPNIKALFRHLENNIKVPNGMD